MMAAWETNWIEKEGRWWIRKYQGFTGLISIWLMVYVESKEKGGNQTLTGVNVDTLHQESENKRWTTLRGRWLVLFWMQWSGNAHRSSSGNAG